MFSRFFKFLFSMNTTFLSYFIIPFHYFLYFCKVKPKQ